MIGETVGPYHILSKLGEGGMGVVYAAEDTRLGRRVAIKFLPEDTSADPEAVQRFLREARAISALNHPQICTLHDIGEHGGRQFMVMEMLEGEPLKTRLARGPITSDDVLLYGEQIADALDAAHGKGIVHRDLKPANLFITDRAGVKVLDFGVAKLSEPKHAADETIAASAQLTVVGSTLGTVQYMSPEQARGQEIDGRSDIFSLGIVLYEMATGRAPFQGATTAAVFEQLFGGVPPAPSQLAAGVPPDFDRIVFRALEKDRELRYQSAADLRADLRRLRKLTESGGLTPRSVAASAPAPAPTASAAPAPAVNSTSPAVAAVKGTRSLLSAAAVVTVLVIGGVLWWRSAQTPALAHRDTVVVANFVNRTGDTMFDDTLSEALGVQLRQSPFLNVLNEQQQQATLRLMDRDPMSVITADIGREVCQRNSGKAVLGGTIASLGSSYLLTLSAQDCVTGDVLAEEQVQAEGKEEVLRALGRATSAFREHLGESLASVQRYDARIEMATTSSLDALKQYSQGVVVRRTQGDFEAAPFFEAAVRTDPEFALAYARLGTVYANLGRRKDSEEMTQKAFDLRERVSQRERLYIEARYNSVVTEDTGKAIETYRLLIATYPDDYAAHTNLGSLLKARGETADAMASLKEAVRLAPEQPTAWLNLAFTYLENNDFAEARKGFEHLLKLQESVSARQGLVLIGAITGDRALEQAQIDAMSGKRDEVDLMPARMAAAAYRGQFKESAALLETWQRRMEQAGRGDDIAEVTLTTAINEAIVGFGDRARARLAALKASKRLPPGASDEWLVLAALLPDAAEGRAALPVALAELGESPDQVQRGEPAFRAMAALSNRNWQEAFDQLSPVAFEPRYAQQVQIWSVAVRGLGRHEDAVRGFQWLTGPPAHLSLGASMAFSLDALATSQEALGRADEARQTRQRLSELWKDADADIPLLRRAASAASTEARR
jgi:tetratricopeptide (TPR) repeat protein